MSHFNSHSDPSEANFRVCDPDDNTPPPNVHDSQPFLVKFQYAVGPPVGERFFLIYDRQRSIFAHICEKYCPEDFERLANECLENGVSGGWKMYRWVKREDNWKLGICLERIPGREVKW